MKLVLTIASLCSSAPELTAESIPKFIVNRRKKNLQVLSKQNKIVDKIMSKPKKFFGITEEMLEGFVSKDQLRENVKLAVRRLVEAKSGKSSNNRVEYVVLDVDDERVLRGSLSSYRARFLFDYL